MVFLVVRELRSSVAAVPKFVVNWFAGGWYVLILWQDAMLVGYELGKAKCKLVRKVRKSSRNRKLFSQR